MALKIVSGGQTGVDRGALRAGIDTGFCHGGWCPKDRRAEDGVVPAQYRLTQTRSAEYAVRTELNVRDSDATLILGGGALNGGTRVTLEAAGRTGKPCLVVDLSDDGNHATTLDWLQRHAVRVLNVAGPRESESPGIERLAYSWLCELFEQWRKRALLTSDA